MKEKIVQPGDKVKLQTRDKEWEGTILESYDSSVILIKLVSGYNIGIKEDEILSVVVLEKFEEKTKKKIELIPKKGLRNIAIVITGGTISARLDPKTGGVISTDAEEILNIAPEIKNICNIVKIEKPFMKWSENMSFNDWKILARVVADLANNKDIDGIVVSHGTDFLHYSAAALSFCLRNLNKPVALTYSQRSIDRASTDAALNLTCAVRYAISDVAEVALVGHKDLNDKFCLAMPGTKVRKMHTSRRDAFKIINSGAIAEISQDKFNILKSFNARNLGQVILENNFNENVALIQVHPGQDPDVMNYYVEKGCKGIVLEVTGIGQLPAQDSKCNWLPKIKKLVDKGIIICATPQTIYGMLNPKVYSAGRDLEKTGIIYLKDMLSETAFIKLSWVLGHKDWIKDSNKIREKMLENISGEFNERLEE